MAGRPRPHRLAGRHVPPPRRAAVCAAAPDSPLAEGFRTAARKGPRVDFFRDYEIALDIMTRYMPPGSATAAIFAGGGVPKDFIQITATSVLNTRRPSAFRRWSPMGRPAASYVLTVSSRNEEHSTTPSLHVTAKKGSVETSAPSTASTTPLRLPGNASDKITD
jgi:hypothetical protein